MFASRRLAPVRGFTLLETLVALLVFSVGLLGIVGLQARSVQLSVDSEDRNKAALLADEVVSAMWGAGTVSLSEAQVNAWAQRVSATFPAGSSAKISAPDADGVVTITVTWRAPTRKEGEADSSYVTKAVVPQ